MKSQNKIKLGVWPNKSEDTKSTAVLVKSSGQQVQEPKSCIWTQVHHRDWVIQNFFFLHQDRKQANPESNIVQVWSNKSEVKTPTKEWNQVQNWDQVQNPVPAPESNRSDIQMGESGMELLSQDGQSKPGRKYGPTSPKS